MCLPWRLRFPYCGLSQTLREFSQHLCEHLPLARPQGVAVSFVPGRCPVRHGATVVILGFGPAMRDVLIACQRCEITTRVPYPPREAENALGAS